MNSRLDIIVPKIKCSGMSPGIGNKLAPELAAEERRICAALPKGEWGGFANIDLDIVFRTKSYREWLLRTGKYNVVGSGLIRAIVFAPIHREERPKMSKVATGKPPSYIICADDDELYIHMGMMRECQLLFYMDGIAVQTFKTTGNELYVSVPVAVVWFKENNREGCYDETIETLEEIHLEFKTNEDFRNLPSVGTKRNLPK